MLSRNSWYRTAYARCASGSAIRSASAGRDPGCRRGPGRDPGVGRRRAPVGRQVVDRAQRVEHRVAQVRVGEVEDHRRRRRRGASCRDGSRRAPPCPAVRSRPASPTAPAGAFAARSRSGSSSARRLGRRAGRRRRPRRISGRRSGCRAGLLDAGLCGGQAAHGVRHGLAGRRPSSPLPGTSASSSRPGALARTVGTRSGSTVGDRGDRGRLGGGERRDGLEPDRTIGGWQAEQPGQVPGLALCGPPGEVDVLGMPTRGVPGRPTLAPRQPERMVIVDEVAGAQGPGWLKCLRVVGDMAVAGPVGSFDTEQSQDDDRHVQRLLQMRYDRLDLGPPRDVDRERPDSPTQCCRTSPRRSRCAHPAIVTEPTRKSRSNNRR